MIENYLGQSMAYLGRVLTTLVVSSQVLLVRSGIYVQLFFIFFMTFILNYQDYFIRSYKFAFRVLNKNINYVNQTIELTETGHIYYILFNK